MARKHAVIFRTIKLSRKTLQRVYGADRGLYEAFSVKDVIRDVNEAFESLECSKDSLRRDDSLLRVRVCARARGSGPVVRQGEALSLVFCASLLLFFSPSGFSPSGFCSSGASAFWFLPFLTPSGFWLLASAFWLLASGFCLLASGFSEPGVERAGVHALGSTLPVLGVAVALQCGVNLRV